LPVWRPAGSYAHDARFPDHHTSKPHGQTVQELRTFVIPYVRIRAHSPQVGCFEWQPVSSRVRSPLRCLHRSFNERQHSAGGRSMAGLFHRAVLSSAVRGRLASPSNSAPRRISRCVASSHAALHKLLRIARFIEQSRSAATLSSRCVNTFLLSAVRSRRTLYQQARSPQTAFSTGCLNESCRIDAYTVS
jgi:hypothetical protein